MRLDGLRVLDLTRLLPGPYATQLLADAGADVIKVEEPTTGDYARAMAAGPGPDVFSAVNRNKRSIALDLKHQDARDAFYRLVARSDVVVEGFRPGVVDRLGVDYPTLREHNEGIVYCSLSGFGSTGPHRDRVGHDLTYIGLAGLLDMTRSASGERPAIPGLPVADMAGALALAYGIVSGVLARELGDGTGSHLEIAMTDVVMALLGAAIPDLLGGDDPRPGETVLTGKFPCYDVYEAADGGFVTLAALEPKFWRTFCEAIDREDLIERQYEADSADRERVRNAVAGALRERTRDEWEERFGDVEAMVGPVLSPREAFDSAQLHGRGLRSSADPPRVLSPIRFDGASPRDDGSLPDLGEHTEAILAEVGIAGDAFERLVEAGAVGRSLENA